MEDANDGLRMDQLISAVAEHAGKSKHEAMTGTMFHINCNLVARCLPYLFESSGKESAVSYIDRQNQVFLVRYNTVDERIDRLSKPHPLPTHLRIQLLNELKCALSGKRGDDEHPSTPSQRQDTTNTATSLSSSTHRQSKTNCSTNAKFTDCDLSDITQKRNRDDVDEDHVSSKRKKEDGATEKVEANSSKNTDSSSPINDGAKASPLKEDQNLHYDACKKELNKALAALRMLVQQVNEKNLRIKELEKEVAELNRNK